MIRVTFFAALTVFAALCMPSAAPSAFRPHNGLSAAPIHYWSNEARQAIVPPGPNGIFGAENYGNKFPGEAAVYMGLVHTALNDAAAALASRSNSDARDRSRPAPSRRRRSPRRRIVR